MKACDIEIYPTLSYRYSTIEIKCEHILPLGCYFYYIFIREDNLMLLQTTNQDGWIKAMAADVLTACVDTLSLTMISLWIYDSLFPCGRFSVNCAILMSGNERICTYVVLRASDYFKDWPQFRASVCVGTIIFAIYIPSGFVTTSWQHLI